MKKFFIANNKKHLDFFLLIVISIIFSLFIIHDLKSWYYSAIGDEYAFYLYAKSIALNAMPININSLFSQNGVYGIIPVLSGVYQGFIMKLFGINVVGWKMSQLLIIIASIFPLFYFVKNIFSRSIAFTTIAVFLCSHYIWAYIKTGYCNLESIFPTITALYFFNKGQYNKNNFYLLLSGMFAGLGFYTFYSSRVIIGILFVLGIFILINKKNCKPLIWTIIGFLLIFIPFLFVNKDLTYKAMFDESLISSNEYRTVSKQQLMIDNISRNIAAFFKNNHVGPYVSGSLVDFVTGILFLIGLILSIIKLKQYKYFSLITWFCLSFLTTGIFSKFSYPAISRLNYLIPVICIFAAIGLEALLKIMSKKIVIIFQIVVVILIGYLNFYRFYVVTPTKYQITREAMAIRAWQTYCRNKSTMILDREPEPLLSLAIDAYQMKNTYVQNIRLNQKIIINYDCFIISTIQDKKMISNLDNLDLKFKKIYLVDYTNSLTSEVFLK